MLLSAYVRCENAALDEFMTGVQSVGVDLAEGTVEAYLNRCEYLEREKCMCSFHACASDSLFTEDNSVCENDRAGFLDRNRCGENCNNNIRMVPEVFLRTPPGTKTVDGLQLADPTEIEDICYMNNLAERIKGTLPLLQTFGADYQTFFGSRSGAFAITPGRALRRTDRNNPVETCEVYDPRARPWYQAASSGPKDVVFVLDTSGSMQQGGETPRIQLLRTAVSKLIGTLGSFDYFQVVKFSTSASTLDGSQTLVKASQENKDRFVDMIQTRLIPAGSTNFDAAFTETFDLLERSYAANISSSCARVIIFITDGTPDCVKDCTNDRQCNCAQPIIDRFSQRQQQLVQNHNGNKPILFAFAMGSESDDNIPRQLVCQNLLSDGGGGGSFGLINEGEDPLAQMSSYVSYLSQGQSSNTPVWSEIYTSFSANVDVTTMSVPVKDPASKAYIGTVGIDVLASSMYDLVGGEKDIIRAKIDEFRSCRNNGVLDVTGCDVQIVRSSGFECVDRLPQSDCYRTSSKIYVVSSEELTFDQAAAKCRSLTPSGGKLTAPTDTELNAFVASISPVGGAWIGFKTSQGWIDGDSNGNFTSWASNEPSKEAQCTKVNPRGESRNWQTDFCGRPSRYICEIALEDGASCASILDTTHLQGYVPDWPRLSDCDAPKTSSTGCRAGLADGLRVLCEIPKAETLSNCDLMCCGNCMGKECPACQQAPWNSSGCDVSDSTSLSVAAIAGIVISAVIGVVALVVIIWLFMKSRTANSKGKDIPPFEP